MEGNNRVTLKLIGFSEHKTEAFFAIFHLAERRLKQSWQVVETNAADFFLLTEALTLNPSSPLMNGLPPERCLFCSNSESTTDSHIILIDSHQVPRLSSLILVLNRLTQSLSESSTPPAPATTPIKIEPEPVQSPEKPDETSAEDADDANFFNPHQGLLKICLDSQTHASLVLITLTSLVGCTRIYLNAPEKIFYSELSLKNLTPYLTPDTERVSVAVSVAQLNAEVEKAGLLAKPLSNLIWFVGFQLSQGRLLQGHSDQENVYLTRWPDLGVHGCEKYVKLAAFMKNNAVALSAIAPEIGFSLAQIHDFYNACHLVGLIAKTDQPDRHQNISSDENTKNMLKKISNRLNDIT